MRARRIQALAVIPLIAGVLARLRRRRRREAGAAATPGKTVSGETETGMKMKVETFFDPADDPQPEEARRLARAGRLSARSTSTA